MNILCFGDSNTYGYCPDGSGRFDADTRWTGLLQKKLGTNDRIIEEGLCGRTTVFSDELREGRRGLDTIGILLESHAPVDLLILMLGTNDCKTRYNASAGTIAKGLEQVITKAQKSSPHPFRLLVISPILLLPVSAILDLTRNLIKVLSLSLRTLPLNIKKLLPGITLIFSMLPLLPMPVKPTVSIWMLWGIGFWLKQSIKRSPLKQWFLGELDCNLNDIALEISNLLSLETDLFANQV